MLSAVSRAAEATTTKELLAGHGATPIYRKKIDTQKVYPGTPGVGAFAALRGSPGGTKGFLGNTPTREGEYPLVRGVPMKFNAGGGGRCKCRRPVLRGAFGVHLVLATQHPKQCGVWPMFYPGTLDGHRLSHACHAFCLFLKGRDGGMRLQKLQTS